ncbi:MAG TPA: hypothetical protein VGT98_12040 [Candidatus Elarobacter sp.]|nr:hypothetical protein [Candidatus Elarobacter sp.]
MHRLLDTLIRYFDGDTTLDDVRAAATEACRAMRAEGIEPQVMFAEFRRALYTAAEHAHIHINTKTIAAVRERLQPWMIDLCFERRSTPRSRGHYQRMGLQ